MSINSPAGHTSGLYSHQRKRTRILFVLTFLVLAGSRATAGRAVAGPPFITDDPEPVDFHHWEVYISSIYQHIMGGSFGTLPHIEINNGALPNLQLHIILPGAFSTAPGASMQYGLGDTELGAKFRFIQETNKRPMVGIFPLLEVPTGDAGRGLGSGQLMTFLPVWIQKSWGSWTSYGGGGYWINPGAGNHNYWQTGILVQKDLNKYWTLGGEIFYYTSTSVGTGNQLNFNVGGQYNFDEGHHLLFSVGRSVYGGVDVMSYVGYQWTFGPKESKSEEGAAEKPKE
jgi:hypothetical protein